MMQAMVYLLHHDNVLSQQLVTCEECNSSDEFKRRARKQYLMGAAATQGVTLAFGPITTVSKGP